MCARLLSLDKTSKTNNLEEVWLGSQLQGFQSVVSALLRPKAAQFVKAGVCGRGTTWLNNCGSKEKGKAFPNISIHQCCFSSYSSTPLPWLQPNWNYRVFPCEFCPPLSLSIHLSLLQNSLLVKAIFPAKDFWLPRSGSFFKMTVAGCPFTKAALILFCYLQRTGLLSCSYVMYKTLKGLLLPVDIPNILCSLPIYFCILLYISIVPNSQFKENSRTGKCV